MDNIRMRKNENKLIIKKGWIAKKFIILYFVIVASVLLLYVNSSLPSEEFKRKYPYVIFFIRFFRGATCKNGSPPEIVIPLIFLSQKSFSIS